ncbi:MAG: tetratricopeptide repeat protein [Rhodospirillaceae bacterium]
MPDPVVKSQAAELVKASECLSSGRFSEAITISTKVLEEAPKNTDALHILGLCYLNIGQLSMAEEALTKAAASRKSDGGIANSLALSLLAQGDIDRAASALERLAKKGKLTAEGLTTLGDCRLQQNNPTKALSCFKKALELKPGFSAALVNLGEALKHSNRKDEASEHYQRVTSEHPHLPSAWRNFGIILQEDGRLTESISALKKYVGMRPKDVVGLKSLGYSYFLCSDFEKSLEIFDSALEIDNEDVEIWNNRGLIFRALGQVDQADNAFKKALSLDSHYNVARSNLAHLVFDTHGADGAIQLLGEAVALEPETSKAHLQLSAIYLLEGKISEGWEEYRWRYKEPPDYAGYRNHSFTPWKGEDISTKTILTWAEQGIGDEILYSGLLPEIIALAKNVIIEVEPRLKKLFERSFPSATVIARTYPADPSLKNLDIDFQISMCETVPIMRPKRELFPAPRAYLKYDYEKQKKLRNKYRNNSKYSPLIGIAWNSAEKKIGWLKSIPLEDFLPILLKKNTTFISLQYGDHRREINQANLALDQPIIEDHSINSLEDMDSYAAQVAAMDLVITNSNTAAHVAGALGVPTWVIVPRLGTGALHWYWFRSGTKSSWYENVRIYRQEEWHSWNSVLRDVADDFQRFLDR